MRLDDADQLRLGMEVPAMAGADGPAIIEAVREAERLGFDSTWCGESYGVDAVTLIMLRMLFALPLFALMAWWAGRGKPALTRRDWFGVVGLGFSGYYLSSFLDFAGLAYITASLERLILYLNPTLVLLFGWTYALFYHLCNGIRHLFWDAGHGFDIRTAYGTSIVVLAAAAALTVIAFVAGLSVRG